MNYLSPVTKTAEEHLKKMGTFTPLRDDLVLKKFYREDIVSLVIGVVTFGVVIYGICKLVVFILPL